MAETSQRLTTIGALERQREAIEQKLTEVKAELDELDNKKRGADVELGKIKKKGLWGRLFTTFQRRGDLIIFQKGDLSDDY